MLLARIETTCCLSLIQIVHFLKDADERKSHSLVGCCFVCTICMIEIGIDGSIIVSTIAEHVA